jgi:hypothetical protein
MAKKPTRLPVTPIKVLADDLLKLANKADTAASLLRTKAMWAKQCEQNGASLESVSAKLGWHVNRLRKLLEPDTDIEIRELSDMFLALGREVHFKAGSATTAERNRLTNFPTTAGKAE